MNKWIKLISAGDRRALRIRNVVLINHSECRRRYIYLYVYIMLQFSAYLPSLPAHNPHMYYQRVRAAVTSCQCDPVWSLFWANFTHSLCLELPYFLVFLFYAFCFIFFVTPIYYLCARCRAVAEAKSLRLRHTLCLQMLHKLCYLVFSHITCLFLMRFQINFQYI